MSTKRYKPEQIVTMLRQTENHSEGSLIKV